MTAEGAEEEKDEKDDRAAQKAGLADALDARVGGIAKQFVVPGWRVGWLVLLLQVLFLAPLASIIFAVFENMKTRIVRAKVKAAVRLQAAARGHCATTGV